MSSAKKFYLSIVIFGILSISLIVFLIYPLFKGIKKNSQTLFVEKNKMVHLVKERENLEKTADIYKSYQSDLDKIETILIDPDFPIEFVDFLEKNASSSQIKLEISSMTRVATTKKTDKEDFWPSLLIQLSATGSFSNFLEFLEKLETSPYLIEVLDLSARKSTEGIDTTVLLSIKVFTK